MPATYPSYAIDAKGSTQQPIEDLVTDQWPNGSSRGRSYFTPGLYTWDILHGVLSDANRATLKTFYDTNRLLLFNFTSPWDSVTYQNVGFIAPPTYEFLPGAFWNVKIKMRQFK